MAFQSQRADFWLPNFGFKRSLLSLLKGSYDWLVSHIPEPIKDKASRTFKALRIRSWGCIRGFGVKNLYSKTKNSFNPVELEQAFNRAYGSYELMEK